MALTFCGISRGDSPSVSSAKESSAARKVVVITNTPGRRTEGKKAEETSGRHP